MTQNRRFKIRRYKVTKDHKGKESRKFVDYVRSMWSQNGEPEFTEKERLGGYYTEMECAKMVVVMTAWANMVVEKPYEFDCIEVTKEFYDGLKQ